MKLPRPGIFRRFLLVLPLLLNACHPSHDLPGSKGAITNPIADGKVIYAAICASCHLENGAGIPRLHPPLDGTSRVNGRSEPLAAILLYGLHGPVSVDGVTYNSLMPMWKDVLNDRQIAAVLTYIRQAWRNQAGEVTPHEVELIRRALPNQNNFLTPEELAQF